MSDQNTLPPAISVLMPCFNGARWIAESIESVLNQTFSAFELIIIDGGSSDGSIDIIKEYIERDSRVILLERPGLGLSASLNLGIDTALGQWIARLDADDVSEPDRLALQLQASTENPKLVFLGAGLIEIDEDGTSGKSFLYPEQSSQLLNNLVSFKRFPPHSSAFYRTSVVKKAGGYRTEIKRAEDLDLWLRLSELGELGSIPQRLVRYRKHANQTSNFEGGTPQVIDARVAVVGYWLRQSGVSDASRFEHPQYQAFREFVTQKYSQYFERHLERDKLTSRFTNKSTKLSLLWSLVKLSVTKPTFVFWLIDFQLFGERVAPKFAREWALTQDISGDGQ
jgi:glycosyltransferase involved in cell wall biosynthesis